eukprot:319185-Chlamydomonas_euryale.AAC.3
MLTKGEGDATSAWLVQLKHQRRRHTAAAGRAILESGCAASMVTSGCQAPQYVHSAALLNVSSGRGDQGLTFLAGGCSRRQLSIHGA